MAPGDREWDVARGRDHSGVILDPTTAKAFDEIAARLGIAPVS